MTVLEQYFDCMIKGDNVALADLFSDYGVLHDSSLLKNDQDILHLEGKMAIEMMFHHKFGFNGGPFKITGIDYMGSHTARYFIDYSGRVVPVTVILTKVNGSGKIDRMDIYPM